MAHLSPIDLQKALGGVDYPADKDALVQAARDNGAGDDVIERLSAVKEKTFDGPNDVSKAVFDQT
ncbi:DUF2795 domain-containing protein [Kitasatospora sp. NPDC018619]|uniref:DUF2795 domain-containing protein n=1 Tax=unclassified Kitasatospora TaxID=2633591 RepID=UPI003799D3DE